MTPAEPTAVVSGASAPHPLLKASHSGYVIAVLSQIVVGVALMTRYEPTIGSAYATTQALPTFLRAAHYWGSALLIVWGAAHVAGTLLLGRAGHDRPRDRALYLSSVLLFVAVFVAQVTGNLLPYDKHGVQSAAIEGGIAAAIPAVGGLIKGLIFAGEKGPTVNTLVLWYGVHRFVISGLIAAAIWLGLRHRAPSGESKMGVWAFVGWGLLVATLAFALPAPLASAASLDDAYKFDARPSWYTWAAHGSLTLWDKVGLGWFGASGMLVLIGLGTLFAAWRPARFGKLWLLFTTLYLGVCALGFGGKFAPLVGKRDPMSETVAVPAPTRPSSRVQDKVLAAKGATLFASKGCANCHGEKGNKPVAGPSLANVGEEHPDREWYVRYIKNPKSVKPSSIMPSYPQLSVSELEALGEYLRFPRSE